jgi:hypothetical protein
LFAFKSDWKNVSGIQFYENGVPNIMKNRGNDAIVKQVPIQPSPIWREIEKVLPIFPHSLSEKGDKIISPWNLGYSYKVSLSRFEVLPGWG